jgi:hypothetical protein
MQPSPSAYPSPSASPSPSPTAARHQQGARHLRAPRARKGRWMVDEYPVGYVAQLARPRPAAGATGSRGLTPVRHRRAGGT